MDNIQTIISYIIILIFVTIIVYQIWTIILEKRNRKVEEETKKFIAGVVKKINKRRS